MLGTTSNVAISVLTVLDVLDLINSLNVASTFEFRLEPNRRDLFCELVCHDSTPHREDVCVVM